MTRCRCDCPLKTPGLNKYGASIVLQTVAKPGVARYGLGVLLTAFLVSAIDRVILGMLVVPIKADPGISDSAMGVLPGISFAVSFTLMGLVAGWLTDRFSRKRIISIAMKPRHCNALAATSPEMPAPIIAIRISSIARTS
jgi:MFS family permease